MSRLQISFGELIYNNTDAGVSVHRGEILPQRIPVAIKSQLSADLPSANYVIREAMSMSSLQHPAICRIFDCYLEQMAWDQYKAVIVMEGMDRDLWKEIGERKERKQEWSDEGLEKALKTLIGALSYAESLGVCHRDIKPQNIFLTGDVLKIGDFGSANKQVATGELMKTIRGSPFFLSPELKLNFIRQSEGQPETPYDPVRSDVYSLGVTILCMALLDTPQQLAQYSQIQTATEMYMQRVARYPRTKKWLEKMLEADFNRRPTFAQLNAELNEVVQPSGPPSFLSMSSVRSNPQRTQVCVTCQRRYQPTPEFADSPFCSGACYMQQTQASSCSMCGQPIIDQTWTHSLPSSVRPYQAFASGVCSARCLEKYKEIGGEGKSQVPEFVMPVITKAHEEARNFLSQQLPQTVPIYDMAVNYAKTFLPPQ